MRTTVRMDAHKPWLPKPSLVRKVRKRRWSDGFRVPSHGEPVPVGDPSGAMRASWELIEGHTKHGAKPHDWESRREKVIEQFQENVIETVTPVGYEDAWTPDQKFHTPADEWAWIEATSKNELAPEWVTMRSNGYRGESLDALIETDDGAYSMSSMVGSDKYMLEDTPYVFELLHGMRRTEAFLKEQDERQWHSSYPKRFASVVNEHGKRGVVPRSRATKDADVLAFLAKAHMPPAEVVANTQAYREQQTEVLQDAQGRRRRRYKQGTFSTRENYRAMDLERTHAEMDAARDPMEYRTPESDDYAPNTPCPNTKCIERGDDCPMCFGDTTILHHIGSTGDEWPPSGYVEESASMAIKHLRGTREYRERLAKDVRDIKAFTPRRFATSRHSHLAASRPVDSDVVEGGVRGNGRSNGPTAR